MPDLLSFADALSLVLASAGTVVPAGDAEEIDLQDAGGRVLAVPLVADRDQPPFHRSTRDGFAVQAGFSGDRTVVGGIRAGEAWAGPPVAPNEAVEIMTGAPVPSGADAVFMVEHVSVSNTSTGIKLLRPTEGRSVQAGENVVPRGAEASAGAELLPSGTRLHAAEIALAASVGAARIHVHATPVVAIIATGDELVDVAATPGSMQIRNSNAHGLAALVRHHGGTPRILPPAADTRESIAEAIASARGCPMLLLSGGVSAGRYDFVEDALLSHGAQFFFTGVRMQPGKPVVFGSIPGAGPDGAPQWIFGLPGNPVSTQVTATLFAMPLLRALGGERGAAPHFAQAVLAGELRVKPGTTKFLPARLESSHTGASVRPTGWQGSGDLHANARANCYLVLPEQQSAAAEGDILMVLLR